VELSKTVYTTILTADYDAEQDAFAIDIQYREKLPRHPPTKQPFDLYPGEELADRLNDDTETVFTAYSAYPDLAVDEALKDVLDERDSAVTHWMTWLEEEGYAEFVQTLRGAVDREGEAYLLASRDALSYDAIEKSAQPYLHDLRKEREQRDSDGHLRSH
jgi:DNA-binding phage protein